MKYLVVTNTASDIITVIEPEKLITKTIALPLGGERIGPSGLTQYKGKVMVANNYSNSISLINIEGGFEERNYYIGACPNDIKIEGDQGYVVCSEGNSLIGFDMVEGKVEFEVYLGEFPHSIALNREENIAYISNMQGNSISVVDLKEKKKIKTIETENLPTKLIYARDKGFVFLCESCLGEEGNGSIGVISTKNNEVVKRIEVGKGPVDLFLKGEFIYVSNMEEGSLSIIDTLTLKEVRRIYIGGMPKGIVCENGEIFVGDYYNGVINVIDISHKKIETIVVGKEPNAMISVNTTI